MPALRQPGPSHLHAAGPRGGGRGWWGKGRDRGAVVARRSPLGEPAVAVFGHSDRRRARASFPPGDSLFSERSERKGGA